MFVCGQRWSSSAESELGLGLVVQVARHQVQVLFPAGGELRTYAVEGAPLRRAALAVGDLAEDQAGNRFVVESICDTGGVLTYCGGGQELAEAALADTLNTGGADVRLLAGQVDKSTLFDLRLEALRAACRTRRSPLRGYTGARIDLLPHQLYVASEVSHRICPRVLLADEVGLGKTIEACLILHRMLVCGTAKRVLILVPEALVHQWFVELLRRFNLSFSIVDRFSSGKSAGNPFLESQQVVCSLDFMQSDRECARQALSAGWDVLVVDEAHHLQWSPAGPDEAYQLVEQLAAIVPAVLLLTASPEDGGLESHFARLRLLDSQRYGSFEKFEQEQKGYASVAKQALQARERGDEAELRRLLDCYGPGRVMFRNTRAVIKGFPRRIANLIELEHIEQATGSGGGSAKVVWLIEFLRGETADKVLVVCDRAAAVEQLKSNLERGIGQCVAAFHEKLSLVQCDRQAAWFAESDGARVLITSGMGGEGRNYQFAHHLVLMDLPDNPELVEQRIGRLDRIGQDSDIYIHVPVVQGSREAGVARWLNDGLNAFSQPMVGGYRMYLEFGDRLDQVDDDLIAETRQAHSALVQEIKRGRNLLLELSSFRRDVANQLVQAIRTEESDRSLEKFMLQAFEQFGVSAELLDGRDYLLNADLLFCEEFPLPQDQGTLHVTFERERALRHPNITLLSWDHPMVQGTLDLIIGSERGACAFVMGYGFSGWRLQALFVLEPLGELRGEVESFLPPEPIMVQLDQSLSEISSEINIAGDADVWYLRDDIDLRGEVLPAMFAQAVKMAEIKAGAIKDTARKRVRTELGSDLQRLQELQRVNDHIRDSEINAISQKIAGFDAVISTARLRLDALRLVVGHSE